MNESVTVRFIVTEPEAEALARMLSQFSFADAERATNRIDGGRERDALIHAVDLLKDALKRQGIGI